jgi:5-formyltetrahydrofolate cyclo-ligase
VSTSDAGVTPTKLALRRTLRAQRAARGDADREGVARQLAMVALELPAIRRAECVAAYASRAEEPGTEPMRDLLRDRGTRVLLPVVTDETTLDWAEDDGKLTVMPALGLAEPTGPRLGADAIAEAQVVLAPALAVDTRGTRLGQGRGYYDRALRRVAKDALVLAVVHDEEVLDAVTTPVPREPHDVAVHGAVTPTRWLMFNAPRYRLPTPTAP